MIASSAATLIAPPAITLEAGRRSGPCAGRAHRDGAECEVGGADRLRATIDLSVPARIEGVEQHDVPVGLRLTSSVTSVSVRATTRAGVAALGVAAGGFSAVSITGASRACRAVPAAIKNADAVRPALARQP